MFIICILLGIVAIAAGTWAILRIANSRTYKITASNGIQENIYVEIGGIQQFMQIRGQDRSNPVALWLHGGPGFPLSYMNHSYQRSLENAVTVVCLEQRGCGRTYYKNGKSANAPFDVLLSDLDEIVGYLKKRFNQDKIIIIAQSWGTVLGIKYLEAHPEQVSAYVGIGQVIQFAKGKVYAAQKAATLAEQQQNSNDAARLAHLISEFEKAEHIEQINIRELEELIMTSAKYLKANGELSAPKQIQTALTSPQVSLNDLKWFLFASSTENIISTQRALMVYLYYGFNIQDVTLPETIPVIFIQGDCDYITPTDIVREYYDGIDAARKAMYMIEDAGHTPFLDHPQEFCEVVKTSITIIREEQ